MGNETASQILESLPTSETGRYLFVLRDAEDAQHLRSDLESALNLKVARASDFVGSAVSLDRVRNDESVLFDRLGTLSVPMSREDLGRAMRVGSLRTMLAAVEPVRVSTVVVNMTAEMKETPDADEFTWGLVMTGIHKTKFTGKGVRIAVLDSALEVSHPDFASRRSLPFHLHSLTDGPPDDSLCIHGTAVTGIIAGPAGPSKGARYSVAPDCEVYFGRVTDDFSYRDDHVIAGIEWLIGDSAMAHVPAPMLQGSNARTNR
jgi:subtilisin family serine protease